jgi:hypothetical protein
MSTWDALFREFGHFGGCSLVLRGTGDLVVGCFGGGGRFRFALCWNLRVKTGSCGGSFHQLRCTRFRCGRLLPRVRSRVCSCSGDCWILFGACSRESEVVGWMGWVPSNPIGVWFGLKNRLLSCIYEAYNGVPELILSFGTGWVCRRFEDLRFRMAAILLRRSRLASVDGEGSRSLKGTSLWWVWMRVE